MSEKTQLLVVRIIVGLILFTALLFMFVINPHVNDDPFTNETLWEAVHPWHPLFDTLGLIGLVGFATFITGYLGKIIGSLTSINKGTIQAIGIGFMLLTLLFFA